MKECMLAQVKRLLNIKALRSWGRGWASQRLWGRRSGCGPTLSQLNVFTLGMSCMQGRRQVDIRISQEPRGKSKWLTFLSERASLGWIAVESKLIQICFSRREVKEKRQKSEWIPLEKGKEMADFCWGGRGKEALRDVGFMLRFRQTPSDSPTGI